MRASWRWAGARSIGTSHVKTGTPCQDYAYAKEFLTREGPVMVAVVSDGAGSASHAEFGSRTVCLTFLKACRSYLARSNLSSLTEDDVWDWVDSIREAINVKAKAAEARPRDFAATMVAILAGSEVSVVIHVGDGAVVLKRADTEEWQVPSWPFQGEYASTTSFVTDDPQPRLVVTVVEGVVEEFAVFSDGIERLILDHVSKTAHNPFFNRMLAPLKASQAPSIDRDLSAALEGYLESPSVCERTDDDKSLILGLRI
ncbi:PP2C family serine/threonine-protein phosphatase [Rhizobium leguminosarum]|uniref:PP2C family serine/threonine-protein phosphatase n=1 Tax=Rhizobium leguminosarum TaxID=384 RepID=UPI00102FA3B8|nr:PP2C family serine/threonine-protein phosphatase [Rhizobium leguminosarum]TAY14051.1 protein phosphatase 2C domain-containing protein [Rhizobium leguminosarum]